MPYILHADLDAFYASVEQLDDPRLKGKPVVVGGRPEDRGVVAACSYEARKFGIHSAMPMKTALNRCPSAVVIQPRFDRYRQVSIIVMDIFRSVTPLVEPMSMDEAYLDITSVVNNDSPAIEVAQSIKHRVKSEVGLTVSIGVASSKSVAKISSDLNKPDGLLVIDPGKEREFLAPLPIRKLSGIGPKTEGRLMETGIRTLGELATQSDKWLEKEFGKRGPEMKAWSLGQDNRPVITEHIRKSISAEATFTQDISDADTLSYELARICQRVAERMIAAGVRGRTVTLKLRLSDFTDLTRSATLTTGVQEASVINEITHGMLVKELTPGLSIRLIGVGVSNFVVTGQLSLFE